MGVHLTLTFRAGPAARAALATSPAGRTGRLRGCVAYGHAYVVNRELFNVLLLFAFLLLSSHFLCQGPLISPHAWRASATPPWMRATRFHLAASQAFRSAGVAAAHSRPLSSAAAGGDVVVCGAGVVGVACAHYLAARGARVTLIDERPALSYTSALSTECYRNWWGADPTMTAFMDRAST